MLQEKSVVALRVQRQQQEFAHRAWVQQPVIAKEFLINYLYLLTELQNNNIKIATRVFEQGLTQAVKFSNKIVIYPRKQLFWPEII